MEGSGVDVVGRAGDVGRGGWRRTRKSGANGFVGGESRLRASLYRRRVAVVAASLPVSEPAEVGTGSRIKVRSRRGSRDVVGRTDRRTMPPTRRPGPWG